MNLARLRNQQLETMPVKWDSDSNRYYIKLKETNKTKIFIDDKKSKKVFRPSTKYLNALEKLLKKRTLANDKEVFSYLNDKTVSNPKVSGLLSKYNFTESAKFDKLYNASINFTRHQKSKMIFEVNDIRKFANKTSVEIN